VVGNDASNLTQSIKKFKTKTKNKRQFYYSSLIVFLLHLNLKLCIIRPEIHADVVNWRGGGGKYADEVASYLSHRIGEG
jgi:hypothetical protein